MVDSELTTLLVELQYIQSILNEESYNGNFATSFIYVCFDGKKVVLFIQIQKFSVKIIIFPYIFLADKFNISINLEMNVKFEIGINLSSTSTH